jgi:hypothetical protein
MVDTVSGVSVSPVVANSPQNSSNVLEAPSVDVESPTRPTSPTESLPPFVSPAVRIDYETQQVVLEFRDSESGEVERQIPSESLSVYETSSAGDDVFPASQPQTSDADVSSAESTAVSLGRSEQQVQIDASIASSEPTNSPETSSVPLGDGDTSSFGSLV